MNLLFYFFLRPLFLLQLAMSGSIGCLDLIWIHDVCFSVLVLVFL